MREFAILVQLILLRPAHADAAPAIGLIAPAEVHNHISSPDAAAWIFQHLSGGLALALPLMAVLMLHALTRKFPRSRVPVLSRSRIPVASSRLVPGMGRAVKEEHASSAPVV